MRAANVRVVPDIAHDFPVLHPINDYLMRMVCSAKALNNVRMLQSHPERDLLVERLNERESHQRASMERRESISHLLALPPPFPLIPGRDFDHFQTHPPSIRVLVHQFTPPHVGKTPRGERLLIFPRNSFRDHVRSGEHPPFTADAP